MSSARSIVSLRFSSACSSAVKLGYWKSAPVFAGTTVYDGKVALRPAIVNWRTTESDVDQLVQVVRELVDRLGSAS